MCEEMGVETGLDIDRLIEVAKLAEEVVGRLLPGHVMRGGTLRAAKQKATHERRDPPSRFDLRRCSLAVLAADTPDPRGGNVGTTINPQVQQAAWEAISEACNGPCKGSVVALEPSTGKILAMVSSPSYDPNELSSHDVDSQSQAWERLRDDPNSPLLNRAISETYPPGSTFKVITTAAALQAGATPNTQLTAAPRIPLPDSTATLENYGGIAVWRRADRLAARRVRQVVQHRVRPARHRHRRRRPAQHCAGLRHRHPAAAHPAAGGRVHRRTDQ